MSTHDNDALPSGALVPASAPVESPEFETLESTQVLQPGYYWTAQRDIEDVVRAGDAHLLLDVIDFEGRAHSVKLLCHPRDGESTIELLVDEFLDAFVPCQDAEAIRQREQQSVMQEVSDLQAELVRVQSDQQLMIEAIKPEVERQFQELEKQADRRAEEEAQDLAKRDQNLSRVHRRAARRSAAKGNPLVAPKIALASELGDVIGAGVNQSGVEQMKTMASQQAVVAQAQANWLTTKTEQIGKTLARLTPYVKEKAAVALARSSGAVKLAERIRRGIETLDLYTGKGVEVFDLRVGQDAPQSEPLTLVQGKRFAEEEFAVWADVDETFDFSDKAEFFDALSKNQALMDQVMPTPRCVVSMAMTRNRREYGDAMANLVKNMENGLVFLLVRNGDNLHVVYSNSPSHEGAERLFPTDDEMEQPFRGWDGQRVSIRDVAFSERVKAFDDLALVYRRFLVLLCGLDHRLGLLGRFYPAEEQMQFMSVAFQQLYFRFLADEAPHAALGWSGQHTSVESWMAHKNEMLRSGSRVFILGQSGQLATNCPEIKRRHDVRAEPTQFAAPLVAFREGKSLLVTLKTQSKYGQSSTPNVRCFLAEEGNSAHDLPWWLCVDGIALHEVRHYRYSRLYRHMGVAYLRLLRRLETYLEAEAAQERDARAYLLQTATEHGGVPPELAPSALDAAVRNWRASRRGAPLPEAGDKAILNEILTLMVPEGHLSPALEAMLTQYIDQSGVKPLLLTRSGKAKMLLYVEASAADRAPYPDILDWGWVRRITLEPGKTKLKVASSTLVWLSKVLPASEVEVSRYDDLQTWLHEKDEPMPLRVYAELKNALEAAQEWRPVLEGGPASGIPQELFDRVLNGIKAVHRSQDKPYRPGVHRRSQQVPTVVLAIPLVAMSANGRSVEVTYMKTRAESMLYAYGTPAQQEVVKTFFVGEFVNKEVARDLLEKFKWSVASTGRALDARHDKPRLYLERDEGAPAWMTKTILANCKRKERYYYYGRRDHQGGKPMTRQASAQLSLDRALDAVTGRVPGHLRAEFYKHVRDEIRRAKNWGRSEDREAEIAEMAARRYVHHYRVLVSPLVLSTKRPGRFVANKLFVAPFVKASV